MPEPKQIFCRGCIHRTPYVIYAMKDTCGHKDHKGKLCKNVNAHNDCQLWESNGWEEKYGILKDKD